MGYKRFEELCSERGVTANIVSKATGVATSTLSNWKKGNYCPKRNKLEALADYFGVSADEFEEPKKKMKAVFNTSDLFAKKKTDTMLDNIMDEVFEEIDPDYKQAKEYLKDPDLMNLILYAGAKLPEENRDEFVEALCKTIDMINMATARGKAKAEGRFK